MRKILVSSSSDHSFLSNAASALLLSTMLLAAARSCNQLVKAEAVLSAYSSSLESYQKN